MKFSDKVATDLAALYGQTVYHSNNNVINPKHKSMQEEIQNLKAAKKKRKGVGS